MVVTQSPMQSLNRSLIRRMDKSKFRLKTWYGDNEPQIEYFTTLKECTQLAASRSKEGLSIEIERVQTQEKDS